MTMLKALTKGLYNKLSFNKVACDDYFSIPTESQ